MEPMKELPNMSPEERFSSRVENYVRFRPGYPPEVVALLENSVPLSDSSVIADIGSGTGISSEMFLKKGYQVMGVEPNDAMREAAERLLSAYPSFHSIKGKAQETTLDEHSVDLITAAQAFHWFDTPETRSEFTRILKPGGKIALIWNERQFDTTPFLKAYEQLLLTFGTDYEKIRHENIGPKNLAEFFSGAYESHAFPSFQRFDFESLTGRLLSSSYTPPPGSPLHEPMLEELRRIFDLYHESGNVTFEYITRVFLGR